VTFDLSAGEVSVMLGPSGTGKSVIYGAIRRADRRGSLSGHVQTKIDKLLDTRKFCQGSLAIPVNLRCISTTRIVQNVMSDCAQCVCQESDEIAKINKQHISSPRR
jgi:ABC-type glutathione transport system ATPase component